MDVNSEDLRLLAEPRFEDFDAETQRDAQIAAFMHGCALVEDRSSTRRLAGGWPALDRALPRPWLEQPQPLEYEATIIRPALRDQVVAASAKEYWDQALRQAPERLDSRVKNFLEGWQVRGREILSIQERLGIRKPDTQA